MYIIPFKGTLKPKACHISGWAERYVMNKKVKRFFKRNKTQYPRTSGVDLCSVNIVTEAEKIIEDYINKMGYRFENKKHSRKNTSIVLISVLAASAIAYTVIKCF